MAQVHSSNRFAINLNSSTMDSRASTLSTVQDLNSASSLSWADDEVENLATLKVQHFLDSLDDYLCTGSLPTRSCFNVDEASQWREMITSLKLMDRLKDSRKINNFPDEFRTQNTTKKTLEITGHGFIQPPLSKFGSHQTNSGMPAPRTRSAYPIKATPPIKQTATSARMSAARSSYNNRLPNTSMKTKDIHQILHDTARLSLHKEMERDHPIRHGPMQSTFSTGLKRMKLQPVLIPKAETTYESSLPPLPDVGRSPPKSRIPFKNQMASQFNTHQKSAMVHINLKQPNEDDHFIRKPASAAIHRNVQVARSGLYSRHPYGNNNQPPYRNDMSDIRVGVVGTSFDPVVRPIRINKFRTHT